MLKGHGTLMQELGGYASPKARLTGMIRSGKVLQVRRGLFLEPDDGQIHLLPLETGFTKPDYLVAGRRSTAILLAGPQLK